MVLRQVLQSAFYALLVACIAIMPDLAFAAKKKQPPPAPKPIYEAPMRVVVVRLANQSCEPLCPEWIAAEGEITPATPGVFRKIFKQIGKKKLPIIIRSPGGSINHALEIGRMIRKRGLDVAVGATNFYACAPDNKACKLPKEQQGIYRGYASGYGGFCNSACPLILAGGVKRYAGSDVSIGVHKPKTIWNSERVWYRETYRIVNGKKKVISRKIARREKVKPKVTFGYDKRLRKLLTDYYRDMGVDPAIIKESEEAEYKDINRLTVSEVQKFKLRTSTWTIAGLVAPDSCQRRPDAAYCVEDKSARAKKEAKRATIAPSPSKESKPSPAVTPVRKPVLQVASVATATIPASIPPMTFQIARSTTGNCTPNCPEWIAAVGVITSNTPDEFNNFMTRIGPSARPLVLESPGGDLSAALRLGRLVKARGIDTAAANTRYSDCDFSEKSCKNKSASGFANADLSPGEFGPCEGACVFVLAAGRERHTADLKLRNPVDFRSMTNPGADMDILSYLYDMKINPDFWRGTQGIPRGENYATAHQWLKGLGFDTGQVSPVSLSIARNCQGERPVAVCIKR